MNYRTCKGNDLTTGASKCPYNREKIVGAIVVQHGQKLPANLTGDALEEACHADRPLRVMPIKEFVEYAKNGGEIQTSAVGYGPNQASGMNAWTDGYTLDVFNEVLNASLLQTKNTVFDVYFYDKNNVIYGMDDGTDVLAGFPMSSIYPTTVPYPTSGAKESMVINFCYKDAELAMEKANYEQVDFHIPTFAYGLTPVKFVKVADNKYKIVEKYGKLDRTAEFGTIIGSTPSSVLNGTTTGVTYDAATETITIAANGSVPSLKNPSELYAAGIKGIVQAA